MEQLIILLVFMAISGLVGRSKMKKPEDENKTQAPQKQEQANTASDPLGKLKQMSRELYQEIEKEFQMDETTEPPSRQPAPPVVRQQRQRTPQNNTQQSRPDPVKAAAEAARRATESRPARTQRPESKPLPVKREEPAHTGRMSAHAGKPVFEGPPVDKNDFIPKDEQDLLKGIIFSEILGPPKSKQ